MTKPRLVALFCAATLAAIGHAQIAPKADLSRAVGLCEADGQPLGLGPDYKVFFDRRGLTFVPALRPDAPANLSLRFELESFGRRGGPVVAAGEVEPEIDGLTTRYVRPGVVEDYEMRANGVKQSFTLAALPEGDGDLLVRARVTADLPLTKAAHDEVRFESDDGGVRIGAVVGIDAGGRRAAGTLHIAEGVLEMSLPAAFVEVAALPLVLDPLIGSAFEPSEHQWNDRYPDVAYDTTHDLFLVVWQRRFSSSDTDIRAQRIDTFGNLVGSMWSVTSSSGAETNAKVANIAPRDAFVVVWTRNSDIWARSFHAQTGGGSGGILVAGGADTQVLPDVGGEGNELGPFFEDEAVVVWWNLTRRGIQAAQVQVSSAGSISAFGHQDLVMHPDVASPSIANTGGVPGRFLVAYEHAYTTSAETNIRGVVIDRNINVLDGPFTIAAAGGYDEDDPAVDGDGTNWVVAWEAEVDSGSGNNDILAVGVRYDPSTGDAYQPNVAQVVARHPSLDRSNPAVAWLRDSAVVAYAGERFLTQNIYDAYLASIDPFTCTSCEGEFRLGTTSDSALTPAVASTPLDPGDWAYAVWDARDPATGEGNLWAQRFSAQDGGGFDRGGGCAGGGTAFSTCSIVGNADFAIRLQHAAPSAAAWLLLSANNSSFGCGCGTIGADPFTSPIAVLASTNTRGNAEFKVPIPASGGLAGVNLYLQWWVQTPGGSCSGFDLSNALNVRIQ